MTKPKWISVDIETFSRTDIKKSGLIKYALDESFEVMLFAYSLQGHPVRIVDLTNGEKIPQQVVEWLFDAEIEKRAWNAVFENFCLSRHFGKRLDPAQWRCTMAKAAYNGLPLGLDACGAALNLDKQKLSEGKKLITYFCVPCKPTKRNNQRLRNLSKHDPEKWELFKQYCIRDVEVEMNIESKLVVPFPAKEQRVYALDAAINRRGFMVDLDFVQKVLHLDYEHKEHLMKRAVEITGLQNPNSVKQLKEWLQEETEEYIASLDKKNVKLLLTILKDNKDALEMLYIRRELAMSSIKKYKPMLMYADTSGCVRGVIQYYGANRTGRFAGRGVQPHNLTKNEMKFSDLVYLRGLIKSGVGHETLSMMYDSVSDCLKQLVRTAIVPGVAHKFVVGDFTAIEAVVQAWLSVEKWRLYAIEQRKDIYIASASQMFHIPEAEITKDSPLRQKGKVSELALGFGGGAGALIQMGALDMGIAETELQSIVDRWRAASPNIVKCWKTLESAFRYALQNPGQVVACIRGLIKFQFYKGNMLMKLPSGRCLVYQSARMPDGYHLEYKGQNQTTKQWQTISTYGGKIFENAVQAIARDLLVDAMLRIDDLGYSIVLHVHDEIVTEVPEDDTTASNIINEQMRILPAWAKGMPVRAEVFETKFYRK